MSFSCFAKKRTKRRRLKEVLRKSALPCADFFGYFLVRRQESNIYPILGMLNLTKKSPLRRVRTFFLSISQRQTAGSLVRILPATRSFKGCRKPPPCGEGFEQLTEHAQQEACLRSLPANICSEKVHNPLPCGRGLCLLQFGCVATLLLYKCIIPRRKAGDWL